MASTGVLGKVLKFRHFFTSFPLLFYHRRQEGGKKEGGAIGMEVVLKGEAKEIADLVLALQGQQSTCLQMDTKAVAQSITKKEEPQ